MRTIEYCIGGEAISDFHCETRAFSFLKDAHVGDEEIAVSSGLFITAVRCLVKQGAASHLNVRFLFRGKLIYPDLNGRIENWPAGFCDVEERFLSKLLG
jgi:hypothetical protein